MEAAVIVTYRCMNRCTRCHTWKHPSSPREEFAPALLERLPRLSFCNVTGGEPFLRDDLDEIVAILSHKARRVVISTNGFFTDKVLTLSQRFPKLGIRVSLEGLPDVNDELRGIPGGFDHGLRTLLELRRLGRRDVGFSTTISDRNAKDMLRLFELARGMGWEFATAAVHNSFYFHKADNSIEDPELVTACLEELTHGLLSSWRPKNWLRAYFNQGIINYVRGNPRLLPCAAAFGVFFVDPFGEVLPCNGMEEAIWHESLGNLHTQTFDEIWTSAKTEQVRDNVQTCSKNCWMIGTVSPHLRSNPWSPVLWAVRAKIKNTLGLS